MHLKFFIMHAYLLYCSSTQVIGAIRELGKIYIRGFMQKNCSQRTLFHKLLALAWKIC